MIEELDRATLGLLFKEIRLGLHQTLEQFYGAITEHVNNMSAVENGHRLIGKRLATDIIAYHHINIHWLKSREGAPILEGRVPTKVSQKEGFPIQDRRRGDVPYYNMQLSEIAFDNPSAFQESPEFYVNFRPFNDCTAYLPIFGDSMYPRFASGEIIAVKEVMNYDVILWGEAYLVVTNQQANQIATVKLLFEHERSDKLILRASNPNFKGDIVVDKRAVLRLFLVKGKITRNQL